MNVRTTNIPCIAGMVPAWYLMCCKPCQDERAKQNLLRQDYTCYRPQHRCERIVRGCRQIIAESLLSGYLFIELASDANWAPLSSTRGVSRMVGFDGMPLRIDYSLIARLQQRTAVTVKPVLEAGG